MSLKITLREVEEVTILDLSGRITLGEGAQTFRDTVRDLVEQGKKRILINMGDVGYIDSSGLGELFSALTRVLNSGCSLKLVNLTTKVRDLLQITKLYTAFEVFDDEYTALLSFEVRLRYALCPLCAHRMEPAKTGGGYRWPAQTCRSCLAQCEISSWPAYALTGNVIQVRLETYPGEHVKIKTEEQFFALSIAGTLNNFASLALRKMWRAMPKPRKVLVILDENTSIDEAGRDALLACVGELEPGETAAIVLSEVHQQHCTAIGSRVRLCKDSAEAAQFFATPPTRGAWTVAIEVEGPENEADKSKGG